LHPAVHVVPLQNWPVPQLSIVCRHCTQVFDFVSHRGVAPLQSESMTHWTQPPALQT
jgi:hypothetical protein